jgi:hypothetical protein
MNLKDAGSRARYMIRGRDGKFPELFDTVLKDAGIQVVLNGVRIPRMNALMEQGVPPGRRLGAGPNLPPRAAGPDPDLERAASTPRPAGVRDVLQLP